MWHEFPHAHYELIKYKRTMNVPIFTMHHESKIIINQLCWRPGMNPGLGNNGAAWLLHGRSLHSLSCHIFPSTWCLNLCSHISLKNTTCCVRIPAPWCKTRKSIRTVRRLPDARFINTLDKVSCVPWWFQNWCVVIKLH
jgi:hypothetical protein